MKKQRLLRYCGILLILLPFLGLYEYMKNFMYVVMGIVLLINSRNTVQEDKEKVKRNLKLVTPRVSFPKIADENTETIGK